MAGKEEINNSAPENSRDEGRISREAKGKQKGEKGSPPADSERELLSGNFRGESLSYAAGEVGWAEETAIDGEMRQISSQADDNCSSTHAEIGGVQTFTLSS